MTVLALALRCVRNSCAAVSANQEAVRCVCLFAVSSVLYGVSLCLGANVSKKTS